MSANFMGGPRVALARIRDSRKQKLQQNALAQGATGAAAAGASTRRDDAGDNETEASTSKNQQLLLESVNDKSSKKRRKEEADDANHGRSIDITANRRESDEEGGSRRGSVERVIAEDGTSKCEDEQQRPSRSTSPDLDQKRRLLLEHDDWLGAGEIEGILRKKRKKGESRTGGMGKKKEAATTAPGGAHGQESSGGRKGKHGERDVAGLDGGEVRRDQDASEEQAHQAATSSRNEYPDAGKSSGILQPRASPIKLQQHSHASEPLLPTKGLPALSLHPEALYTNSIKGLFTSGALGRGNDAKALSEEARLPASGSRLDEENASKAVINEAKALAAKAARGNEGEGAEAKEGGELEDLEELLVKQREDTRRRLFGGH